VKKPVKRAILLDEVLFDLVQVEEILLQLELRDTFDALTDKQARVFTEILGQLRRLVEELSADAAQEHRAA
jgi:hypothetical protein